MTSPTRQAELKTGLQNVWAAPTRAEAEQRGHTLVGEWQRLAPAVADWLEGTLHETLAFYVLPEAEARRRLRTTNAVEHDHAEVRRRTTVVRIFPNEESYLRLGTALAIERTEQWAERRYFSLAPAPAPTSEATMRRSA